MEKFKSFMHKLKKNMLGYIVVWLIFAILLVPPVTYTITDGYVNNGQNWIEALTYNLLNNLLKLPITEVIKAPFLKEMELFSCNPLKNMIQYISVIKTLEGRTKIWLLMRECLPV